jgi:tRNA-2-methylthio-N6-dimethylallyladenosine synthase
MPSRKLFIKTYGCQMNFYDSSRMSDILKPLGYSLTDTPQDADLTILNTCHIREKAEQKMYSDLGRLHACKKNKQAEGEDMLIAVGGCVGQAEGSEIIKNAPYVSMVFGPQTYHRLPEMIAQLHRQDDAKKGKKHRGLVNTDFPVESKFDHLPTPAAQGASAFLSIQEGCDKFCHFCVVPYTRGAEYSRSATEILSEARTLLAQGVREITLLGQNVNGYHGEAPAASSAPHDTWTLGRLLFALAELEGLARIRYMTSHPRDMHEALYHAHRDIPTLMPYVHLPVQSGSNAMLQAMNRKHTIAEYEAILDKLRTMQPGLAFSSDFIVGYPGETEAHHEETLALIQRVGYAQGYSFKYSPRPGTPAAALECHVDDATQTRRLAELQELIGAQQKAFNQSYVGQTIPVLFDRAGKHEGQLLGKSPYMQSVHVQGSPRLAGHVVDVRIISATQNSLTGEVITGASNGLAA